MPTMSETEVWREVKGHPGILVSKYGSLMNTNTGEAIRGFLKKGVYMAYLPKEKVRIAEVVAKAWISRYHSGYSIKHYDGDPEHCAVYNLQLLKKRKRKYLRKGPPGIAIRDLTTGLEYETIKEAARQLNIDPAAITKVLQGRQKTAGKRTFEKVEN